MMYRILTACAGLVLLVAGCADPQRDSAFLGSLPDPSLAPGQTPGQLAVAPISRPVRSPSRPALLPPVMRPFSRPLSLKPVSLAQPGWVPAIGVSDRWTCLVIHHSASDQAGPAAMDRAHRMRGWDELGYHFVIGNGVGYPDGQIYVGSRWTKQKHGAHCKVPGNFYNEHGIGICLMGNFEGHMPTEKQLQSLAQLVLFLEGQCGFGHDRILTHGGVTGKTRCPGRYFSMNDLLRRVSAPMYANR